MIKNTYKEADIRKSLDSKLYKVLQFCSNERSEMDRLNTDCAKSIPLINSH